MLQFLRDGGDGVAGRVYAAVNSPRRRYYTKGRDLRIFRIAKRKIGGTVVQDSTWAGEGPPESAPQASSGLCRSNAAALGALRAAGAARLDRRTRKRGDLRVRRWVTGSNDGDSASAGSAPHRHAAGGAGAASACDAYVRCSAAVSTPRPDVCSAVAHIAGACAAVLRADGTFETPAQGPSSRCPAPPCTAEEQPAGCGDARSSSRSARASAVRGCGGGGFPRGGYGF
jgi:hypothetical protein